MVVAPSPNGALTPPELSDDERHALHEFWRVFEPHFDTVAAGMDVEAEDHPEAYGLLGKPDSDRRVMSRELIRTAIVDHDWLPYLATVDQAGMRYAATGLGFGAWFGLGRALRISIMPHVIEALRSEPERLATAIRGVAIFVDLAMVTIGASYLAAKERTIAAQQEAILELSTPVLELFPGLVLLPLVGMIDSTRAAHITSSLLEAIPARRSRVVIVDVTGVPAVDTGVATHLMNTAEAARLMGATSILAGLSAANAQTLAGLGVSLGRLRVAGTLPDAIADAAGLLGRSLPRAGT